MATVTERLQSVEAEVRGVRTRQIAATVNDIMYSAIGESVVYGCKVTEGADDEDMVVTLEGEASGDEAHHNPDVADPPARGFEYPNIASLKDGAFRSVDLTATVEDPPATGEGRYDIAYVYVGPSGAGFAIATGTPSTDVFDDFDSNGVDDAPYPGAFDPELPVGAMAVARIYVEDDVPGIPNARIADLRIFSSSGYADLAKYWATQAAGSAADADADATQTALDAIATAADRVQTGLDAAAAAASVDTINTIDVLNWLGV